MAHVWKGEDIGTRAPVPLAKRVDPSEAAQRPLPVLELAYARTEKDYFKPGRAPPMTRCEKAPPRTEV